MKDGDVISVRFNSDENQCSQILAENPVTLVVTPQIENRVARIEGPGKPEIGQPATYQAIAHDNSVSWTYQWILSYADGQQESPPETGSTLTIAKVGAGLTEITVTQIAPEGDCIDRPTATLTTLTEALPITLLYLKAGEKADRIVLEWATAMEQNNAGFEVQVSSDAVHYRLLGFVPSVNTNSYSRQAYTFQDQENGRYGTRYYRLKQVDLVGTYAYFGPVAVNMQAPAAGLTAYPNPFSRDIQVEIEALQAGKINLVVVNALGSTVMEKTLEIEKGSNKKVLALEALPAGVYTLITHMNGQSSRLKLVKQ
jgi:hypothetical protein